jgi:hypothetical protein
VSLSSAHCTHATRSRALLIMRDLRLPPSLTITASLRNRASFTSTHLSLRPPHHRGRLKAVGGGVQFLLAVTSCVMRHVQPLANLLCHVQRQVGAGASPWRPCPRLALAHPLLSPSLLPSSYCHSRCLCQCFTTIGSSPLLQTQASHAPSSLPGIMALYCIFADRLLTRCYSQEYHWNSR